MFDIEKQSNHVPATVKFINKSTNANKYQWDFGDGHSSEEINPEHRFTLSGKYHVALKAMDNKKQSRQSKDVIFDPPHQCLVEIHTTAGSMMVKLFDETPHHRDNFIKLAEDGYFDDMLFHRVIKGFMIQAGDPDSKNAPTGKRLGSGGPGFTLPAEFIDTLVHIKGALAAARQSDAVNPKKASSGSQFYIVQGRPVSAGQLENFELQKNLVYTPFAKKIYSEEGGTPTLDKEYTVFGKIVKGLEVIDLIADSKTDSADRPLTDVKIISIKIIN
jgi:peptidyl-prolyl cis-trans isomerase B (cyclophilin B)